MSTRHTTPFTTAEDMHQSRKWAAEPSGSIEGSPNSTLDRYRPEAPRCVSERSVSVSVLSLKRRF